MNRFATFASGIVLAVSLFAPAVPSVLAYSPDDQEWTFLDLVNAYRTENGLGTLTMQDELGEAADYHSFDMAANGYFAHTLADGTSAGQNIANHGYTSDTWGEIIAAGMPTAAEAMQSWQNSPEHNSEMLNPAYTEVGVGRYYQDGTEYGWYWTTTFGGGEFQQTEVAPEPEAQPEAAPVEEAPATINGESVEEPSRRSDQDTGVISAPQQDINGPTTTTVLEEPSVTYGADGGNVRDTGGGANANGDGQDVTYGDIEGGSSAEPIYVDGNGGTDSAGPSSGSAPVTETTTDSTGTVTTTTTVNGVQMEDGNATEYGNAQGRGASADPGQVTYGN
jgi:uncharacterized protein YkwD